VGENELEEFADEDYASEWGMTATESLGSELSEGYWEVSESEDFDPSHEAVLSSSMEQEGAACCGTRGDEPKFAVYPGATAEGLAEPYNTNDPTKYGTVLWDYKVNDYTLRPAHSAALRALVTKIAADDRAGTFSASGGWVIGIDGFASRTGDFNHNKSLSYWRATVAARCLECLAAQAGLPPNRVSIGSIEGKGYEDTAAANVEDPRGRRIVVTVKPPGAKSPSVKPRTSNKFTICILDLKNEIYKVPLPKQAPGLLKAAVGIIGYAKTTARYRITDRELGRAQTYLYVGKGVVIDVPVDKIIPKKAKDVLPKPLWDLLGKVLGNTVPGGRKPGRECAPFDVFPSRTADPIRNPPAVIDVQSFGGATDMAVPAPGLGGVQIGFKNTTFRYNAKATYRPNPLEIDTARNLTTRVVILTDGTSRMVAAGSKEAEFGEAATVWHESTVQLSEHSLA
jgi:outer membrane protein OmpA-like peptidoglycan-associated protein